MDIQKGRTSPRSGWPFRRVEYLRSRAVKIVRRQAESAATADQKRGAVCSKISERTLLRTRGTMKPREGSSYRRPRTGSVGSDRGS